MYNYNSKWSQVHSEKDWESIPHTCSVSEFLLMDIQHPLQSIGLGLRIGSLFKTRIMTYIEAAGFSLIIPILDYFEGV